VITEIDVRGVLARIGPDRQDLVTRHTGRAVRFSIESELSRLSGRAVVVLDFTAVRLIDCSCADEIVAKLVQGYLATEFPLPLDAFFLIRGLNDHQVDELEEVLRRQHLALVAESRGTIRLIGDVAEQARIAFERLAARGHAAAEDLADELAWPLDVVRAALDELALRHLVLHEAGSYQPPTAAA
jgi:hypothetical protein